MLTFGERLRRARERKGLTQVDVYFGIVSSFIKSISP